MKSRRHFLFLGVRRIEVIVDTFDYSVEIILRNISLDAHDDVTQDPDLLSDPKLSSFVIFLCFLTLQVVA